MLRTMFAAVAVALMLAVPAKAQQSNETAGKENVATIALVTCTTPSLRTSSQNESTCLLDIVTQYPGTAAAKTAEAAVRNALTSTSRRR